MEDQWQRLNNGELRRLLKRYRLLTLPPLVLGLLLTLLLTWLRVSSVPWGLLYLLLIVAMMPALLKSGALHREWRRRRKSGEGIQFSGHRSAES